MTAGGAAAMALLVVATAVSVRAALACTRAWPVTRRLGPPVALLPAGRCPRAEGECAPRREGEMSPGHPSSAEPGAQPFDALRRPPAVVTSAVAATGIGVDAAAVWHAWLAALVGLPALVVASLGPGAALVVAAAVAAAPSLALWSARHRADARLEASLPGALDAVARALRAGGSLTQALASAARTTPGQAGDDLRRVAVGASAAAGVVASLEAWAVRRPLPGVRLAVAALSLGAETGGASARAVDGVAATLRHRLAAAAEVRALSASARASATVIAVLPVGFAALAAVADPRTAPLLLRAKAGLAMLAAGLALDGLAAVWMARLSRIDP